MINWARGISARHYATIVDPLTLKDVSDVDIINGTIKYSDSGERASADVECRSFDQDKEYWIRVYLSARQGTESELVPLFTGIVSLPDVTYNGRVASKKLKCYSSLSITDKIFLPLGWYINEGSNGAEIIKNLLSEYTPSPVNIKKSGSTETPIIPQKIIAEQNETVMTMIDKILGIINWRVIPKGDGSITIAPQASSISAFFDHQSNDVFEMSVTIGNNWYDVPNVYRAVGEGISSVAKDEDPNSRFSIKRRGREIWVNDVGCVLANNEQIGDYAIRKLKEAQQMHTTLDYTRRFDPNVDISDLVQINYLDQGISGVFKIKSQSLTIGYGGKVSEQAEGI